MLQTFSFPSFEVSNSTYIRILEIVLQLHDAFFFFISFSMFSFFKFNFIFFRVPRFTVTLIRISKLFIFNVFNVWVQVDYLAISFLFVPSSLFHFSSFEGVDFFGVYQICYYFISSMLLAYANICHLAYWHMSMYFCFTF